MIPYFKALWIIERFLFLLTYSESVKHLHHLSCSRYCKADWPIATIEFVVCLKLVNVYDKFCEAIQQKNLKFSLATSVYSG